MAAIFGDCQNADEDGRSTGGKILRSRRTPASSRTPYARPEPRPLPEEPPPSSGNLNWLAGLISPARVIASGAGKMFSTVLGPDSDSSSSSSGGNSNSEYEDDVSFAGDDELNKKLTSLNMKDEKVYLIQQLVMQETFSREECNELIKLIKSRIVKGDKSISNAGSKLKEEDHMCETNQGIIFSPVSESETGSTVNMAKTYMNARPAWSSPSSKHVKFRTSSSMENLRDELSRSIFHSPLQLSETKRTSLWKGSWNILEEIRRVRAKATEELLAPAPSKRIDLPPFSPKSKPRPVSLPMNKNEANPREDLHNMPYRTSIANSNPYLEVVTANCSWLPGCQKPHDMNGSKDSATTGHAFSLSVGNQTSEPGDKEMIGAIHLSRDKVDGGIPNENLEHEAEPSNAIHGNDYATGSQNSSNVQHEDLSKDATWSNPKLKPPPGILTRGYSRRRGRGK